MNVDRIKLCFNEPHNERYKLTEITIHHLGWVVTTMIVTDTVQLESNKTTFRGNGGTMYMYSDYLVVEGPYRIDWGPGKVLKKSLLCVGLGVWEPCILCTLKGRALLYNDK